MAGGGRSAVTGVRRSRSGLILALLALLGVPVAADPLRFAWPTPAQALVTVEAAKGGYTARSSVRLRLEMTADGPEFRRAVFAGLATVAGQDRQSLGDLSPGHVETASRRQTLELVTDPTTLRPYRVDMGTHIAFKLRGQPVQTQTEAKSFLFGWR